MSLQLNGDTGVTFNDSSLQGAAASPYVLKNRIINGDMRIDQRNAGASVTPSTGTYTLDRWRAYQNVASKFTVQQSSTAPAGFTNSIVITSSSAYTPSGSNLFLIEQNVEGYNMADFNWGTANAKTVTLSFWVRSSLTGTFGGSLVNGSEDLSYPFTYTISAANTWEQKTVTIAGPTTGTWNSTNGLGIEVNFGIGAGSTYQGTAGSWQSGAYFTATGTTNIVATNGATFYFTGVQLEIGTSATPFERRLYNQELANCQRYLPAVANNAGETSEFFGYSYQTNGSVISFPFLVQARVPPSGLTYSGTWNGYNAANSSSSATFTYNVSSMYNASVVSNFTSTAGTPTRVSGFGGKILFTGCEL